MLGNFNKKNKEYDNEIYIDKNNIPKHIAIIMDGNGRWAKSRNLPRSMGHKAGVEAVREIVKECNNLGIKYLTLYVFSTENWKRPKDEVSVLMKLLVKYLRKEFNELNENNVVINHIGDIHKLPELCEKELNTAYENTKNNTGLILNLAINYGGRSEITRAFKLMNRDIKNGILKEDDIDDSTISNYLYTKNMPDPDLIIRPSGEQRLSNFLLWQCAYSEFWYSDINWPDFKKSDLHKAIYDYQNRDRRFGAIK
ncbi:undecaprenyl diphosphate synthase [Clostridium algifaecis]|uniref:Isoprenyl transferase n=1 Tax=Clostridium algifaecis TaxID=1472040 RepID=A0ABS4KPZ8_9CLOT|nr:isoprenyl transferase [Clostridium algifaecis]MBP2031655.1 undecaprenyl diphosphate synthase [Clostridium algifaecis]